MLGANGLANPRDFLTPVASFEDKSPDGGFEVINKYQGCLFKAVQVEKPLSPLVFHFTTKHLEEFLLFWSRVYAN